MKTVMKLTIAAAALAGAMATAAPARAQDDGGYCREYTRNVVIGGQVQHAYGTACRQEDGTWQIQNQQVNGETVAATPPPQDASRVSYLIHEDNEPVYVQPTYVQYAPAYEPYSYEYAYPFVGYYGGYGYDHWHGGGYYGGYHGGYGGYHGGYGGYHH